MPDRAMPKELASLVPKAFPLVTGQASEQALASSQDPVIIRLGQISRTFQLGDQAVHALDAVDLEIRQNEYLSIMGPSGCGKSTLLHAIGLLDKPDSGSYLLDGIETTSLGEEDRASLRRQKIGFVFQSFHLIPRLTAQENIELPMLLEGIPPAERHSRAAQIMQRLNLTERAGHKPMQLSGGQQQRVAIARAIVMKPRLLLADEPTGNLDSKSGQDVIELLEELYNAGITLLTVTHDASLGQRARRRIQMLDGRIVEDSQPANRVTAHASR